LAAMPSRPVIGLCTPIEAASWGAWRDFPVALIGWSYVRAVQRAGAVAVLLPPDERADPDELLDLIDGLLLVGGTDVDPASYGAERDPATRHTTPERDEFELALVGQARARNLPILAICRGIQVLNVACGGSLIQDIPSEVPGALTHKLSVPPHQAYALAHEVWIDKDTLLWRLMRERLSDADACEVNSRHHQAVKRVAAGFQICATAPDGVIEAIEDPAARFCLGVQWHPENFFRTGEFRPLFEGFLEAATRP
jgi:putative glutamine amidotransferase